MVQIGKFLRSETTHLKKDVENSSNGMNSRIGSDAGS